MSDWQPIETAPRDRPVLIFGEQSDDSKNCGIRYDKPIVFAGYWCSLDEAWCCRGSTWTGPFFEPTHWMPLPDVPAAGGGR